MILINKGTTNSVHLTLTENMVSATNSFLFYLRNEYNGYEYTFTASNISLETERYDLFIFDDTTLNLTPGQYEYIVYEDVDVNNIIVASASPGTILENGRCVVKGTQSYNPLDKINTIYL